MNTSIRQVVEVEMLEALYPLDQYCLNPSPPFQNKEEWKSLSGMTVGEGNFAVRINDPLCPWNEGTWRFEACEQQLLVTKAASAGFDLSIQGLSALVAGTHDPEDFSLRGWGNPEPQVQAVLHSMFPKACPYLHEYF